MGRSGASLVVDFSALWSRRFPVDFKVHGVEDYATLMASLRVADPKMMDVAVPANMRQGLH